MDMGIIAAVAVLAFLVLVIVAKSAIVVPQQSAYIVERLGRYAGEATEEELLHRK